MATMTKDYTYTIHDMSSREFGVMLTALKDSLMIGKTVNQTKTTKNLIELFEETAGE